MRLRIRTLLLTVALLCSMTTTASACIYIPILDPFCWLFGCCGYGYGGCGNGGYGGYGYPGYAGGGYSGGSYSAASYGAGGHGAGGYGPVGYSGGYVDGGYPVGGYAGGPNPYGVRRCIDDWLGWGYLRNQEGTLGHYPGRPAGCYQPCFPGLFAPCAPPAPVCGMTAPMVAPYFPMLPPPLRFPLPPVFNPCWNPCGPQYRPQPVAQCQPNLTYPYAAPVSAYQMPMGNLCCDGGRGDGMEAMMPGQSFSNQSTDSGCCGSGNGSFQSGQPSVAPAVPQSTMLMSPGSMMITHQNPYTTNLAYRDMRRNPYYGRTASQGSMSGPMTYRQSLPMTSTRSTTMYRQPQRTTIVQGSPFVPVPQATAWQVVPSEAMTMARQMPRQFSAAPMQYNMNPMAGASMPRTFHAEPMMMGDISGDHEFSVPTSAAVPVLPNAFNGRPPIRQASFSQPVRTTLARRYPNSVQ